MRGEEIAFGPGRADILEYIGATGSLRTAAERMGISYMRAWQLVKTTNQSFREPLVEMARGGKSGGGAKLTATGRVVLDSYRQMESQALSAIEKPWARMKRLLKI
ncbi:MAG TPA: LysR family transcriptional regulator [Verrucomicrobiae bacterium]|nr:LysR family transcriptional regulator [Verrucomicrobiae bacterium]